MDRLRAAVFTPLLLASCARAPALAPVPPALPAETIPLPPVSNTPVVWHPGDWDYTGGSYRYEPGHYQAITGNSTTYVFGHWTGLNGRYFWVQGDWR